MSAPHLVSFAAALLLVVAGAPAQGAGLPRGVTAEAHAAIERGEAWLVAAQAADGSWSNAGGYGAYPVSMTGLAGMALLSGGSTPTRGPRFRAVRSAATWLQRQADRSTGLIGGRTDEHHVMFGHGYATLMLATVFGMEEDVRAHRALKNVLDGAVRLTESAQSSAGGWIYRPGVDDDEGSVTVTQLQALRACRMAGIVVDSRTIARAVDYLRRCQNADGGIRYKLAMVGSSRPAITAAAVVALWNAGQYDDEPFVAAAIAYGDRHLTSPASVDGHRFYAWHYWSQAQWQRGGSVWTEHQRRTSAWLLREQRADGSWHGDGVGPVYGTAIALQILRLPYAQVPVYQR